MFSRMNQAINDRHAGVKREEGFTLIELLVVVIIIGILAAIAIPIYIGVQNNAKDSAVKSDVSNAKTAVVAHATSNNGAIVTLLSGLVPADGYTIPSTTDPNYASVGNQPTIKAEANNGFCIQATSVTTTVFSASDTTGVVQAACP